MPDRPPAIRRWHHAQITIPNGAEAEARRFYCELLGLPEINKPKSLQGRGGFWLQLGEQQLHVGSEEGVNRLATKAHLAYQVDDVDGWRAYLEAHGVQPLASIPIPGFRRFETRDPFGNRMEFIEAIGADDSGD
jgi:catechol 2,3-dioxygenase-like lactoylglutathione lyase family enzyme